MAPESRPWPAPAKLNLFLHVTGRREDGFHELQTLFQLLDWGDELDIEANDSGRIERSIDLPGIPPGRDLSLRAAELLRRESGTRHGARIGIHKRIPAGAGLGGASSDAATVLSVLNRLWGCGLDIDRLAGLGLRLGADVPLFVRGHSAWAEGVGERLQPLELGARHYLLLFPELAISTASVFADPGLRRDTPPLRPGEFLDPSRAGTFGNDCEAVVLRRHPELSEMLAAAAAGGHWRMSGTGSAFFIEMAGRASAERAAQELKSRYNVRAVGGVNRSPLMERLTIGSGGG